MRSHSYDFTTRELVAALLPSVAGFVILVALVQGLAVARWLPEPRPLRDMDHAVLWNRVRSSHQPARVVLVGDSSCLMGVSARQLGDLLRIPVRNLGAMSPLGLDAFSTLAADAVAAAGANPPVVVVLVHPEFLRRPSPDPRLTAIFRSLRDGDFAPLPGTGLWGKFTRAAGLDRVRDHLELRIRSQPLPAAFRKRYGFTRELLAAMDGDGGGAVDPGRFVPGTAAALPPLDISPRLEAAAAAFASRLPPGIRLRVGVMPIPKSLAGPGDPVRHERALATLCRWLGPQASPLSGLPTFLPDADFASATHLNEAGRAVFTGRLAEVLAGFN